MSIRVVDKKYIPTASQTAAAVATASAVLVKKYTQDETEKRK